MSKAWYPLCTKPKNEKRTAAILNKKGVETFLPQNILSRKNKKTSAPLFPGVIFIRISASKIQEMRTITGVIDFLYLMDTPATISNEEIEAIRSYMKYNKNIIVTSNMLAVENNNTADKTISERSIQPKTNSNSVVLHLPSLGYVLNSAIIETEPDMAEAGFQFLMKFQPQPSPLT